LENFKKLLERYQIEITEKCKNPNCKTPDELWSRLCTGVIDGKCIEICCNCERDIMNKKHEPTIPQNIKGDWWND